jgi:hypothetical protein
MNQIAIDPARVIRNLTNKVAQLEQELAVKEAYIEQLLEQLEGEEDAEDTAEAGAGEDR